MNEDSKDQQQPSGTFSTLNDADPVQSVRGDLTRLLAPARQPVSFPNRSPVQWTETAMVVRNGLREISREHSTSMTAAQLELSQNQAAVELFSADRQSEPKLELVVNGLRWQLQELCTSFVKVDIVIQRVLPLMELPSELVEAVVSAMSAGAACSFAAASKEAGRLVRNFVDKRLEASCYPSDGNPIEEYYMYARAGQTRKRLDFGIRYLIQSVNFPDRYLGVQGQEVWIPNSQPTGWTCVAGLKGNGVSFCVDKPKQPFGRCGPALYLVESNGHLWCQPLEATDPTFSTRATFFLRPALASASALRPQGGRFAPEDCIAIASASNHKLLLRHQGYRVKLHGANSPEALYNEDTSWHVLLCRS